MTNSRRTFIKKIGVAALTTPLVPSPIHLFDFDQKKDPLEVHIFSKHLQFLDWKAAAQVAADIGFYGLDLTVRPKGHVFPEKVKEELPKAINDIKSAGLSCDMITTAISDASNPLDADIIKSAAAQGVKFYRSNWFKYKADWSFEESLDYYEDKVRELSDLNAQYGIVGCYQNHSGTSIGSSVWEVKKILGTANPKYFGAQYDIRHAVAEGGRSWSNGVKLLRSQIKTIVLKDFKWGKVSGKWKIVNVPIGEGMVDFNSYFQLLKSFGLKPPVSLHLEYPLGGAEKGLPDISVDQQVVFDAMKKDLTAIQQLWQNA
ncbi:sugar phosphate isomerase/epimerase [Reichenbachiella carrageenanivorans]|uniref:Sugar phosphate isomerase/epimerase n=1 Tax=Reichenbachiella carrageenanivorans TaxID=2979869 RepID=A0ABY6D190_9BACT|nr:sugar phosphate isomerase/epimerase family protein [Reichenbachiella carrageenanivorans]UXX79883.1 sugar phosphate isomerase/epimerase [Reichenbachiella carrageenanivorans]